MANWWYFCFVKGNSMNISWLTLSSHEDNICPLHELSTLFSISYFQLDVAIPRASHLPLSLLPLPELAAPGTVHRWHCFSLFSHLTCPQMPEVWLGGFSTSLLVLISASLVLSSGSPQHCCPSKCVCLSSWQSLSFHQAHYFHNILSALFNQQLWK